MLIAFSMKAGFSDKSTTFLVENYGKNQTKS
jgi:hypothetical protein